MAEQSSSSQQVTVNVKGPSEIKLSVTIDLTSSVKDLKEAIHKQKEDVPPEWYVVGMITSRGTTKLTSSSHVSSAYSQRLIYSGKVLKDEQPLSEYKLQNNHTIHLVKSATARSTQPATAPAASTPAASSSPTATANTAAARSSASENSASHGVPANFGAGQQFTNNPLAALNRADLAGPHMASIGRQLFQGTGMNPADPNMMMNALDSPEFQQHMRSMLSRPEVIDQVSRQAGSQTSHIRV